ncbi:TIGR00267 family protein [Methanopyrus sp.]
MVDLRRLDLIKEALRGALSTGRYMALGSMDGLLASLGAVLSASLRGGTLHDVVSSGLSVAVALALSNGLGSYLGEKIEELREIRRLERRMILNRGELESTRVHDLARVRIYTSVISHGGSSFAASMIPILTVIAIGDPRAGVVPCVIVSGVALFLLGAYLGRLCGDRGGRLLLRGLEMAGVGGIVGVVTHLIGAH